MTPDRAIGVDIGGTNIAAGIVSASGVVVRSVRCRSRAGEGAAGPIEAMAAAVDELRAGDRASIRIGVGAPGAIHPGTGELVGRTPHLPAWSDFPLLAQLRGRFGPNVVVDNDANLAAFAEHRVGATRGARASLTVTIGTGVGCGIVVDGRLLRGAWGGAGEIGHLPLGDGRMACACGVVNCVEPEISGSGLVRAAAEAGLDAPDAEAVFASAARGVPAAVALVDRLGDRLGAAIAVAVNVVNPEIVAIGGGVGGAGDALLSRLRAAVARYALPSHRAGLTLVPAALGARAGMVGAGLLAMDAWPAIA